jgi:hypothetical protein
VRSPCCTRERSTHYIHAEIDADSKAELSAFPDLWTFLETCQPDASVEFNQLVLPVRDIGKLVGAGFFARYLRRAYPRHDWPGGTCSYRCSRRRDAEHACLTPANERNRGMVDGSAVCPRSRFGLHGGGRTSRSRVRQPPSTRRHRLARHKRLTFPGWKRNCVRNSPRYDPKSQDWVAAETV